MKRLALTTLLLLATTALAQERAWRDVTFGMTSAEYREALAAYEDVTLAPFGVVTVPLAGTTYNLMTLWPDDQLGRLMFRSPPLTAMHFDGVLQRYLRELAEIITAATGTEPKRSHPSFLSIRPGVTWTHTWPVGDDGVLRRVGVSMLDFEYRAVLWVEDEARVTAWEQRRQAEETEAREDTAEDF